MDNHTSVSIIIPVYNPGEALRKCLESLVSQSYSDIEIIIVNDGSTDSSDSICTEFASKDSRIVYISQKNAGVSAARNKGIDTATGEFLCFVDSDDFVDSHYVRSMMDAVRKSHADIVIQGLKQIKESQVVKSDIFESGVFPVSTLTDKQFDDIFYYCGPYCKLFRTTIVKDCSIYFPTDMAYGEDAVFYHSYLANCKLIELLSSTHYNYTVANQGALSTKILSPDKFWQNQSKRRGAYLQLKNAFGLPTQLSDSEQACKLTGIGGMLNSIFKSGADDNSVCRYLDMMICDKDFCLSDTKPNGLRHKLILHLIKSNSTFSRRILKRIYQ